MVKALVALRNEHNYLPLVPVDNTAGVMGSIMEGLCMLLEQLLYCAVPGASLANGGRDDDDVPSDGAVSSALLVNPFLLPLKILGLCICDSFIYS